MEKWDSDREESARQELLRSGSLTIGPYVVPGEAISRLAGEHQSPTVVRLDGSVVQGGLRFGRNHHHHDLFTKEIVLGEGTHVQGDLTVSAGHALGRLELQREACVEGTLAVSEASSIGEVRAGRSTLGGIHGIGDLGAVDLAGTKVLGDVVMTVSDDHAPHGIGALRVGADSRIAGELRLRSESRLCDLELYRSARVSGDFVIEPGATVHRRALFQAAVDGGMTCAGVQFTGSIAFSSMQIGGEQGLDLSEAVLEEVREAGIRAKSVTLRHATLGRTLLRLGSGDLHLEFVTLNGPLTVTALDDSPSKRPRIVSLRGVDASKLVLECVDLSECRFRGALQLENITISPRARFERQGTSRFSAFGRQIIAEDPMRMSRAASGTEPGVSDAAAIAELYRRLRRARDDSRDYTEAGDFYFREMRLRELSMTQAFPTGGNLQLNRRGLRRLLQAYRLIANFGLSVVRPLFVVLLLVAITSPAFATFGVQYRACTVIRTNSSTSYAESSAVDTQCQSPVGESHLAAGLEAALESTVGLVREPQQTLTLVGTAISVVLRVICPVLIAFSALALRTLIRR